MTLFSRAASLVIFFPVIGLAADPLPLTQKAESAYGVFIPANAAEPEEFAAQELVRYVEAMTGARLPLKRGAPVSPAILIGRAAPADVQSVLGKEQEDAYLIRSAGRDLILAGASPRSTLYAVYAFLESVGCGFPRPSQSYLEQQVETPGPQEEYIPHRDRIDVAAVDRLERPVFTYRALVHFPMIRDRTAREIDWAAKNRFNWAHLITNTEFRKEWDGQEVRKVLLPALRKRGMHIEGIGHSFFAYMPPEDYLAEHPEYFAMGPDGKRLVEAGRGGLCVSNPAVVRTMAEKMDAFLKENQEIEIIDLWTNDSAAWCLCAECKKMQGVPESTERYTTSTRSYLRFVNQVAERLAETHPKVRVNALAYALNLIPDPETKAARNVIVGIAPWGRVTYMSSDDYYVPLQEGGRFNSVLEPAIRSWMTLAKDVYLYDYYGARFEFFPIVDVLRADYRYYQKLGLKSLSTEVFYWPEFNMWAYGRLCWKPETPLKELAADFCKIAYHDAAEPMTRFHLALERWKWEWPSHRGELSSLLKEAQAKAAGNETVVAKLKRLEKVLAAEPAKNWTHGQSPPPLE